jgi:hypothetical protein
MNIRVDTLSYRHREEFCYFLDCRRMDRCLDKKGGCSKWEKNEEKTYAFLKIISSKLKPVIGRKLCVLSECSYRYGEPSSCSFWRCGRSFYGEDQYCSRWFYIPDLSILDTRVKRVRFDVDIGDVDRIIRDISERWNIEMKA